jgi:hypothetical protein
MLPVVSARNTTSGFGGITGVWSVCATVRLSPGLTVFVTVCGSTPGVAAAAIPAIAAAASATTNGATECRRTPRMRRTFMLPSACCRRLDKPHHRWEPAAGAATSERRLDVYCSCGGRSSYGLTILPETVCLADPRRVDPEDQSEGFALPLVVGVEEPPNEGNDVRQPSCWSGRSVTFASSSLTIARLRSSRPRAS